MFASLTESIKALNTQENLNDDANRATGIEPSADMMGSADNLGVRTNFPVSRTKEPTVDQHLQTTEEAFFETIDQVIFNHRIRKLCSGFI